MNLDEYNPYPGFRAGQKEAAERIIQAVRDGIKVVEYKGPTGCGKSLVLTVVARALQEDYPKCTYTTPQKSLVRQLAQDKRLRMISLLGRANYPCDKAKSGLAVDCMVPLMKRKRECPDCPYMLQKEAYKKAPLGVATLDKILTDLSLPVPNIMVMDECQGVEAKLLAQRTIQLPDWIDTNDLRGSIVLWKEDLEKEYIKRENVLEIEYVRMTTGTDTGNPKLNRLAGYCDLQEVEEAARKLKAAERKLEKVQGILKAIDDDQEYVCDAKKVFKLLRARGQFARLIGPIETVIMASGTPCTAMLTNKYARVEAPHPVDVERRRVYFYPCGKMNVACRNTTVEKMGSVIAELHSKYNRHTLVHCHSYPIAELLGNVIRDQGVECVWQDPKDRDGSIELWMSRENSCFLSVACEEGLDLPGEEYPLNIIAKVPFGFRGDEWLLKRIESDKKFPLNQQWENVSVAISLQQAAGRCTRGPNDWSVTYILDTSFEWFYLRNYTLFESWFKDALQKVVDKL